MSSMSRDDYQKLLYKFPDLSQLSTDLSPNFDFWCYEILFEKQKKSKNSKISEISKKSKISENSSQIRNFQQSHVLSSLDKQVNLNYDLPHLDKIHCTTTKPLKKLKAKQNILDKELEKLFAQVREYYKSRNKQIPSIFRRDAIRKKIKTKFFRWLRNILNKKLREIPGEKKSKFEKLQQSKIARINLEYNSALFYRSLYEIYMEDESQHNIKLIKTLETLEKMGENINKNKNIDITNNFLDVPLSQLYQDYSRGKQFRRDFNKIKKKINLNVYPSSQIDKEVIPLYLEIYEKMSKIFMEYYKTTCSNKRSSGTNCRPNKYLREIEFETQSEEDSE